MLENFKEILNKTYFNNQVLDYLTCLGILIASYLVIKLIKAIVVRQLKKWSKKTVNTVDDFLVVLLEKLMVPFLYCVAFYASLMYLKLPSVLDKALGVGVIAVLTLFAVKLILRVVQYGFTLYWIHTSGSDALESSLKGILKVIKFIIWSIAVIFFLDNLGFEVSTVIAGLGIGGVAIALAAQAVLGDLFSYFSIILDRPFEVGDFIIINDLMGVVEHIGIKTTRIRSLGGEQLVFANSDLTNSRVKNYKRMEQRRVVFTLGVIYDTTLAQLKEIPKIIEKVIKSTTDTRFDRAHFFSYGDFSLNYESVYYVLSGDYNKYMDIQQDINFKIKEEFEKKSIEFAFPTQTIHMAKEAS